MHLIALLLGFSQTPVDAGLAARYGYPGDRYAGKPQYACQSVLAKQVGDESWQNMLRHGVAHRSLPCGTPLIICTKKENLCTKAWVVDRGPFGAVDAKGRWHARKHLKRGERWRGILDLLPGPAKALELTGLKYVYMFKVPLSTKKNHSGPQSILASSKEESHKEERESRNLPSLFFQKPSFIKNPL